MNKSQSIRDYFAKHPSAGLTEIAKALSAQGIAVTASHVQQALRGLRGDAPAKPVAPKSTPAKPASTNPAPPKASGVVARRPRAATLLKREAAVPTPAPAVSRPTRAAAAPRAAVPRPVQKSSVNVVEVIELARKLREAAGSTTDAVKILNSLA